VSRSVLELPKHVHRDLLAHLLPPGSTEEEAAFVFAKPLQDGDETTFSYVEHRNIARDGFARHLGDYLELSDQMRAAVIKRAHDLDASIVEFHSHPYLWPAAFSASDRSGLEEFVPHVWWRLKGKPYAAVVVAPSGFDALVWLTDPRTPQALDAIRAGGKTLAPTRLTLKRWNSTDERGTLRPQHPFLWQGRPSASSGS
jgi:proteasome lid subunit RPN8/RPN11